MALIVQKYGGTSVGSPERILAVAARVKRFRDRGDEVVVVVSAMSGETDRLIKLAKGVNPEPPAREMDVLLSTGEQVTIALLAMTLEKSVVRRVLTPVIRCISVPTACTARRASCRSTRRACAPI